MVRSCLTSTHRPVVRRSLLVLCATGALLCECTAFNPAFVSLFSSNGSAGFATLPNAPGHVVIALANQTEIDERLLTFLASKITLTDAQKRALRPRLRMRLRVTYVDGTFQTLEFIDGSPNLVDPTFDAQAFPDLNQNDLNNAVVLCDVARVEVEPGTSIEVFIPVELLQYQLVLATNVGGGTVVTFQQRGTLAPQFRPLRIDDVDADGNVTQQRNIGVRDVPSPTPNVICGSVVAITVKGTLAVPFLDPVSAGIPSYDSADAATIARIGGRYEFIVTVQ
jgi:hypothetical protein